MNYTHNNPDHEDTPQDWLLGALVFSRAVGLIIPEGKGIIVDLKNDMIELYPDAKRIIVAHIDGQIKIIDADDTTHLKEGDWVVLLDKDTISN